MSDNSKLKAFKGQVEENVKLTKKTLNLLYKVMCILQSKGYSSTPNIIEWEFGNKNYSFYILIPDNDVCISISYDLPPKFTVSCGLFWGTTHNYSDVDSVVDHINRYYPIS